MKPKKEKNSLGLDELYVSAIRLLARREYSKQELQTKLVHKGYDKAKIVNTIYKLEKNQLQSDERFAENYIHSRLQRGFGPIKIRFELNQKGVAPEIIEQYLVADGASWDELAQKVRGKKFGNQLPGSQKEQLKQRQYLYYKGFNSEQIRKCFYEKD